MRASLITPEGLEYLAESDPQSSTDFVSHCQARLATLPASAMETTHIELPDLDWKSLGRKAAGDGEAAKYLYRELPPSLIGRLGLEVGFWTWLSLSSAGGASYLRERWDQSKPNPSRVLGTGEPMRQALYRLWLGANLVCGDSPIDANTEIHITNLFHLQDLYEAVVQRKVFRDPVLNRSFAATCKNREIDSKQVQEFAKRINAVMGVRHLSGLGFETLNRELETLLEPIVKNRNTLPSLTPPPPPPPRAGEQITNPIRRRENKN